MTPSVWLPLIRTVPLKYFPSVPQHLEDWIVFLIDHEVFEGRDFLHFELSSLSASVQFSHSGVSDSLQPHGLQHLRLPYPSPTARAYSNSCPLCQWWMWSNHLILCHPLLLLPSIFSSIRVFSNESVLCIRWPRYWSFSFSFSPSSEYSGLISFRMDWLDLLAVQGTLKSLLQHHSSKASILWCLAFFIVQLSHAYMTTGKTIALTRWTFVSKVMSLPFNILSRFAIAFLPRSKRLLISWLQSSRWKRRVKKMA